MRFRLTMKDNAVFTVDNRHALDFIRQLGHQPVPGCQTDAAGKTPPMVSGSNL
jgi:hypothetical protein